MLTEERQEKIFENKKLTPRTSVEWTTNVPLSLRFYGFTMMPNNPPKVFIRDGDALFIATEADIVEYRIERIGTNSLALEDLIEHRAYTLTLPGLPKR